jgi:hypothetical protein
MTPISTPSGRLRSSFPIFRDRRSRRLVPMALAAAFALSGCEREAGAEQAAEPNSATARLCRVVTKETPLPPPLGESSGLAASRKHRGVFWTHNDSGGDPAVYGVNPGGQRVASVRVKDAENQDWEDMAIGPCPGGGDCLYLADTGNNGNRREISLYRVPEPAPGERETKDAQRFRARFPQGSPDAEAIFVLPDGAVYLVTKGNREPVELYRWPLQDKGAAELQLLHRLAPRPEQLGDRVTGASASPDGQWVAIRTYSTLALYRTPELLAGRGPAYTTDLSILGEAQGEAVSLGDDGTVVLTTEGGSQMFPGGMSRLSCNAR